MDSPLLALAAIPFPIAVWSCTLEMQGTGPEALDASTSSDSSIPFDTSAHDKSPVQDISTADKKSDTVYPPVDGSSGEKQLCPVGSMDCDGNGSCETDSQTNPTNCGSCGHSCLGGDCVDGQCKPFQIASGLANPNGIAANGQWVAFTDYSANAVYKLSAKTVGALQAISSLEYGAGVIAMDDQYIYWVSTTGNNISYAPLDGPLLPQVLVSIDSPVGLALQDSWIYFTTNSPTYGQSYVQRTAKSLSSPVILAYDQLGAAAIAADAEAVYWSNTATGDIWRLSLNGLNEAKIAIASGQPGPLAVAVDDLRVYWTCLNAPVVMAVPKSGGAPIQLASVSHGTVGLALEGKFAWFTEPDSGALRRVLREGSSYETLVLGAYHPFNLALDSTRLYWTNWNEGTVMALAR